jgi:Holliday junction resolvase
MATVKQRKMLESRLQAYFIRKCRENGAFAVKLVAVGRRGFPDVLVLIGGQCYFVELKNETKGRLSFPQQRMIAEMEAKNAEIFVLSGLIEVDSWLQEFFGEQ